MQRIINQFCRSFNKEHVIMDRYRTYLHSLPIWSTDNQQYRLRFAHEEDFATIIDLEKDAYDGYMAWNLRDFMQDYARNPYCVYILCENIETQQIVGMVSGRFLARGAHISHLIVHPSLHARGIGSRLLETWIELVRREKIPVITLEVRESNRGAQRLYERFGFIKQKVIHFYYDNNAEAAYFLCKEMIEEENT